jgi:ATP-dependent DNA ligase
MFDLLYLNGEDFRKLPLLTRKQSSNAFCLLDLPMYCTWITPKGAGQRLFELTCQLDLEGIVEKRAASPYGQNANGEDWIKIKNPNYSQKEGRRDLFRRAG